MVKLMAVKNLFVMKEKIFIIAFNVNIQRKFQLIFVPFFTKEEKHVLLDT